MAIAFADRLTVTLPPSTKGDLGILMWECRLRGPVYGALAAIQWHIDGHYLLPGTTASLLILIIAVAGLVLAMRGLEVRGERLTAVVTILAATVSCFILQGFPLGGTPTEHQWRTIIWSGLVPAFFLTGQTWWTPLTQMFIHADLFHIFGNMLMLFLFGLKIEERIGRRDLVLLYVASGLFAGAVTLVFFAGSTTPNIGASGAVYGLIGFAIAAFPHEKVLIPTPIIMTWASPWVALLFYVAYNFFLSFGTSVAWWAHLAGMAVGLVWGYAWRKRGPRVRIDSTTGWGSGGPVQYTYTYQQR